MTPAETSLARVRALSEGKLKLPTIRTVPIAAFVTAPAPSDAPPQVFRYATIKTEPKGDAV